MYILCTYEKNIVLSLSNIYTLNLIMCILRILTWSLKTYAIRLRNLISMNILFTEDQFFVIIVNRDPMNQKQPLADVFQNMCF